MSLHRRRNSLRLERWDYSDEAYYFVTLRVNNNIVLSTIKDNRICLSPFGFIVRHVWKKLPSYEGRCSYDAFIIMPDHIHAVIYIKNRRRRLNDSSEDPVRAIHESPQPLPQRSANRSFDARRHMLLSIVIGRFKMLSAKSINLIRRAPSQHLWQRGYYDHIIRDDSDLHRIREYIEYNPLQWSHQNEQPSPFLMTAE